MKAFSYILPNHFTDLDPKKTKSEKGWGGGGGGGGAGGISGYTCIINKR